MKKAVGINLYQKMKEKYKEIGYKAFYRSVFPKGSFETQGVYNDGKYNGILVEVEQGGRIKRHTVLDDHKKLDEVVKRDNFCIMSPIGYAGKSRSSNNARLLYAIAIDLDGVEDEDNLLVFFKQIKNREFFKKDKVFWCIPLPTYIVCSGTGLHLYYVFKKPVPLFRNVAAQLEKLKRRITWQVWTQGASNLSESVQYESLYQGFRVVGTITKVGTRVKAFKVGPKMTLEELQSYVPEDFRVKDFKYNSSLPLDEAKKRFPAWYQRRVVEHQPRGTWRCKRALYDWWKRRLIAEIQEGHRYWGVMTLAIYAKKCGIPFEELKKEALELIPHLNGSNKAPFVKEDVLHALEAYRDSYMTYPIDTIIQRTDLLIQKNKRNGRRKLAHLRLMRGIRKLKAEMGEKVSGGGRPKDSGTKKEIVSEWQHNNPGRKKADCIRETGLAKMTVYKWWNKN